MSGRQLRPKKATLYNFTYSRSRKISHQGDFLDEFFDAPDPSFVEDEKTGLFKCERCSKHVKSKVGLTMHAAWCRKRQQNGGTFSDGKIPVGENQEGEDVMLEIQFELMDTVEAQVASVLRDLVNKVCGDKPATTRKPAKSKMKKKKTHTISSRRGAKERRSYSNDFKSKVIQESNEQPEISRVNIAIKYGIDRSLVSKWKKNEKKIVDAAITKKMFKKNRPSWKQNEEKIADAGVTIYKRNKKMLDKNIRIPSWKQNEKKVVNGHKKNRSSIKQTRIFKKKTLKRDLKPKDNDTVASELNSINRDIKPEPNDIDNDTPKMDTSMSKLNSLQRDIKPEDNDTSELNS